MKKSGMAPQAAKRHIAKRAGRIYRNIEREGPGFRTDTDREYRRASSAMSRTEFHPAFKPGQVTRKRAQSMRKRVNVLKKYIRRGEI
jgi:hypothetical protein